MCVEKPFSKTFDAWLTRRQVLPDWKLAPTWDGVREMLQKMGSEAMGHPKARTGIGWWEKNMKKKTEGTDVEMIRHVICGDFRLNFMFHTEIHDVILCK